MNTARDRNTIYCYAKRLLNPFRGAIHIVRYQSAEAVTTDGIHWDIYVSNDELLNGIDPTIDIQTSDVRYGSWDARRGLKRGPIIPSDEFKRLEHMGAVVYEHLLEVHARLPFPFTDTLELWLLDSDDRPVALLNSETWAEDIEHYQILDFRAGLDCRHHFLPEMPFGMEHRNPAELLNERINAVGDGPPAAQWFSRQPDGAGTGLTGHHIDDRLIGREMALDKFPEYYLRDPGVDATFTPLVAQYIEWQAPWFLLLDTLKPYTRAWLEDAARTQAIKLDAAYPLIPEVIDEEVIGAARVEARLRKTHSQSRGNDQPMSTFYIELNPGPTD